MLLSYHRGVIIFPQLKHQYSAQILIDTKRLTSQELTRELNHEDKEILL